MPSAVQLELARRAQEGILRLLEPALPPSTSGRPSTGGALELARMPKWARTRALARGEVLAHLREYRQHAGPSEQAIDDFAAGYNAGRIEVSPATRAALPCVSTPSLRRWSLRMRKHGLAILGGRYGNARGTGFFDRNLAMREVVLAMLVEYGPGLRAPRVCEALRARFPDFHQPLRWTVAQFMRRWRRDNPSLAMALADPDRWRGRFRTKIADAAEAITRLNQEWQIDGTPGDILLAAPGNRTARCHILAIIDIYSRRAIFQVARAESASAAIHLIVRALLAWGIPEAIHGDNGAGFVSNHARRFLDDLGIEYIASPPFRPETKPFVESLLKTMSHQLLAMLPGFTGHNVAERQALRARTSFAARFGAPVARVFQAKLTPAELQDRLDRWAAQVYNQRPHAGIANQTPAQAAAAWTGEVRRIENRHELALLAGDAAPRRIARDGISIAGARFVPLDSDVAAYVAHIGETALCFPDPSGDLGRYQLFLDSPGGRKFVATVENRDRAGLDRGELALLARQAQDRFIRDGRAELNRLRRRIRPETLVDAILGGAAPTGETDGDEESIFPTDCSEAARATGRSPSWSDLDEDRLDDLPPDSTINSLYEIAPDLYEQPSREAPLNDAPALRAARAGESASCVLDNSEADRRTDKLLTSTLSSERNPRSPLF
jgi:transposase InsO family protein